MKGMSKVIIVLEVIFCIAVVFGIFCAVMAVITEGWSLNLGLDICLFVVIIALNIVQLVLSKKNMKDK